MFEGVTPRMVFSSVIFLYFFLPIVMLIYWAVPYRMKNYVCLIASLLFYAWGEPVLVFLMLGSIVVNYFFGLMLDRFTEKGTRKWIVTGSVIFNLCFLGVFKYSVFIISSTNSFLNTSFNVPEIALPLGISFFTFQAMSYIFDVYRGKTAAQRNVFKVALYISAFPKVIQGPIVQYSTIVDQIDHRTISLNKVASGIIKFAIGLAKKVLLANIIGQITDSIIISGSTPSTTTAAWLGIICYALQIYFDFSGYSDMAIGLARMMGFEFEENFRYPYISKSVSEFWRRWHISMGAWFRDYLYIPLGGSRCSKLKQIRNILIVWLATGIWHGAGWTFIIWGLYFFVLLAAERLLASRLEKIPSMLRHVSTLLLVLFSWVIFRSETIVDAANYFLCMLGVKAGELIVNSSLLLHDNWLILVLGIVGSTPFIADFVRRLLDKPLLRESNNLVWILRMLFVCGMLCLCTVYMANSSYNPFIYFKF